MKTMKVAGAPSQCVFPFTYSGVSYNTCTTAGGADVPWCAFDAVYDATRWGKCDMTSFQTHRRTARQQLGPLFTWTHEKLAAWQSNVASPWAKEIDILIPWSGEHNSLHVPAHRGTSDDDKKTEVARSRDNGELQYLLRSIAQNAPWVRRVWIIINTHDPMPVVEAPAAIANRVRVIDRCSYMPKGTCPTVNSFVAMLYMHHLPDLAERFVVLDDDTLLGRGVMPSHFFDTQGRPFVWRKAPNWGFFANQAFHPVYPDPTAVANFPLPRSTSPNMHLGFPALKSVCASMEKQYPELYAFVGSHVGGRYSSIAKGYDSTANSQEVRERETQRDSEGSERERERVRERGRERE